MLLTPNLKPAAAYLAIANTPSIRLSNPELCRKLLVLDLNGAIILRRKKLFIPKHKMRPVPVRAYLASFTSFIFHETVKPWLDVMVWSTLEPHAAEEMAGKCFGDRRTELKAVWARDALGLSKAAYYKRVPAVKNLEKPCVSIPELSEHTAASTLLVDKECLRPPLQPYNHLCISEFTRTVRNIDMRVRHDLMGGKTDSELRGEYDTILIALIGILDELKLQSNIPGWIMGGGLWGGYGPPLEAEDHSEDKKTYPTIISNKEEVIYRGHDDPTRIRRWVGLPLPTKAMWFEHKPSYQYWLERGKTVATNLNIELVPGVEPV